ncbi:GvpL/GvpF family gas vesicle protein [Streptomyces sp. NPDC090057]|uniref:GvpL/GvpF family gas vesicle protein n=1 Tax=Streptomyces sp. NPDC090057 TaxID=3365935 RepID=UPI003813776C
MNRPSAPAAVPAGRQSTPTTLTCVFAVTRTPPPTDVLTAAHGYDEGGPLRLVAAGPLWLVAQDVPAASFDAASLGERLNRPEELERCARAHHRGVAAAARRGPVVPLPMATLYLGDLNAARAVSDRETELCALLDRLRGRTEWAVKVHAAEASASGAAGSAAEEAPAGGRAYLSRVSARRRTRSEAQERALAAAHEVDRELRRYAVAATRHRPQSEQLTGRSTPQLLNAAYLVDDAGRADFAGALARLTAGRIGTGIEITASGPWIPYSFARLDQEWDGTADPEGAAPRHEGRP